ncbi:MAG: hypothetical protein IKP86_08505 [Anaerolineaceae bacterium]|nr:hypothetical protein [Anaerolineaceae bacterium]
MAEQNQRSLFTVLREHAAMGMTDGNNARRFRQVNRETAARLSGTEHPVLFFNASTRLNRTSLNAAYAWITANSLRYADVPVHFISCGRGLKPCLLSVGRGGDALCSSCMALSRDMYAGLPHTVFGFEQDNEVANDVEGLDHAGLSVYEHDGVPLGELTLPSLRWILRKHHLEGDPEAVTLHRAFIRSAWSIYLQAWRLIDELEPRAVVVFNGLQYPEAVVKWLGKSRNIPTFTHEIGLMPNTAIFTEGEATACPIDLPDDFVMTPERDEKLDDYLSKRMKGTFSTAGVQFWPEMKALPPEFWERARTFRQIVPVFTNVIFDTSQKHANVVFDDMFSWLDEVKGIIENHSDTLFVIRAHPDETRPGKESHETVTDWVKKNQLTHLPNVMYVPPEDFFSSYELIQSSKFVMVYNSTIGLEAAIMGAGVLSAGRSRYTQVPLCWFPKTIPEYMEKCEELLNCDELSVPESFRQTARRFMYFQFFHTALSFDRFIAPDETWKGYVKIKKFPAEALDPEQDENLRVIHEGILEGKPFVLPWAEESQQEMENTL